MNYFGIESKTTNLRNPIIGLGSKTLKKTELELGPKSGPNFKLGTNNTYLSYF